MPRYTQNPPAKYLRKITTLAQAYFSVFSATKQLSPRMRMLSRNILFFLFLGLSAVAFAQEATLQFNQWYQTEHAAANEILAYTPAIGASEIRATISTPLNDCSSAYFSVTGPTHLQCPENHLTIKIGRQERVLVPRDARRPDRFKLDAAIVQRIKTFDRMEVTIDGQIYEFSLAGSYSALSSLKQNCDTLSREKQAQDIVAVRNSGSILQLEKKNDHTIFATQSKLYTIRRFNRYQSHLRIDRAPNASKTPRSNFKTPRLQFRRITTATK